MFYQIVVMAVQRCECCTRIPNVFLSSALSTPCIPIPLSPDNCLPPAPPPPLLPFPPPLPSPSDSADMSPSLEASLDPHPHPQAGLGAPAVNSDGTLLSWLLPPCAMLVDLLERHVLSS